MDSDVLFFLCVLMDSDVLFSSTFLARSISFQTILDFHFFLRRLPPTLQAVFQLSVRPLPSSGGTV